MTADRDSAALPAGPFPVPDTPSGALWSPFVEARAPPQAPLREGDAASPDWLMPLAAAVFAAAVIGRLTREWLD